jgi:hypothetical protein
MQTKGLSWPKVTPKSAEGNFGLQRQCLSIKIEALVFCFDDACEYSPFYTAAEIATPLNTLDGCSQSRLRRWVHRHRFSELQARVCSARRLAAAGAHHSFIHILRCRFIHILRCRLDKSLIYNRSGFSWIARRPKPHTLDEIGLALGSVFLLTDNHLYA